MLEFRTADAKAEKLAQARKKLRDYQSKHHKLCGDTSPSPSVSSSPDTNGRRSVNSVHSGTSFNHEEKVNPFEGARSVSQSSHSSTATAAGTVGSSRTEFCDGNDVGNTITVSGLDNADTIMRRTEENANRAQENTNAYSALKKEYDRLVEALSETRKEKDRIASQLSDLHGHYSEIYMAYSKLNGSIQTGGVPDSAVHTQLAHLQTAMSVIVKEKTELQRQLRESNELSEHYLQQLQTFSADANEKGNRIYALEKEMGAARKEVEALNITIQRQMDDLDRSRKEATNWQARAIHIQQDRNDAQERLKQCMKEAEAAQIQLEEARKQLRMKEIYLKQMGAYSTVPKFNEKDIENLHEDNEQLRQELLKAQTETQQLRKEMQAAKEHYEAYGSQMNQNVLLMSNKLEELSNEKMLLQSKVQQLEDELEVIRAAERAREAENGSERESLFELVKARNEKEDIAAKMRQAEQMNEETKQKLSNAETTIAQLTGRLREMEDDLTRKSLDLSVAEESLARSRRAAEEQRQISQDVHALTEQLQNEKATVSRAIAQNRELKEQLIELQDKLVSVSQESMERESGRLTALHTIEMLNLEVEKLKSRVADNTEETTRDDREETTASDETMCSSADSDEDDRSATFAQLSEARERAEAELLRTQRELTELRSEHRRVTQQNEELRRIMEQNAEDENQNSIHVELTQAIERINTLSAENDELRKLNRALSEGSENGEVDATDAARKADHVNQASSLNDTTNGHNFFPRLSASGEDTSEKDDNYRNGYEQRLQASLPCPAEKPLAWTELEARFARTMRQNAELIEQNERLEHVILQLQSENDTIGEYVTIYHHQRKLIRDRMREKEEAVARLSLEKEQIQQKLSDLQTAVIGLLTRKGILRVYDRRVSREKKAESPGVVSKRANKLRSFSHSTVDEFSGDEETIVDGSRQFVPDPGSPLVMTANPLANGESAYNSPSEPLGIAASCNDLENGKVDTNSSDDAEEEDIGVQKVLSLINELQDIDNARLRPPCDPKVHCRECRGKLITL